MESQPYVEQGSRVLAAPVFAFILESELKRAARAQNFLTLVTFEARREWEGLTLSADPAAIGELAEVIGREIRDTDLLGTLEEGQLSLLLLDADLDASARVIDRLMARLNHYDFPTPLRLAVGAACYPTHAVSAASLRRQSAANRLLHWQGVVVRSDSERS